MADTGAAIVDQPLHEAMDFSALKQRGLDELKALAGATWTNFNDSDPGVTILDQLCYALTEVAYCADFPIEDVLANPDGTITYANRFFTPQDILSCSPVTRSDYRKLVHDRLDPVRAVCIEAGFADLGGAAGRGCTGRYSTALCLHADFPHEPDSAAPIIGAVHDLLNEYRNVGELFLRPTMLQPLAISLGGSVQLARSADPVTVRGSIVQALREYEAPLALQRGYQQLRDAGFSADQIFNGPQLDHGAVVGQPADKCDEVSLFVLYRLLAQIEGVVQVAGLQFLGNYTGVDKIVIDAAHIAAISLDSERFVLMCGASRLNTGASGAEPGLQALLRRHEAAPVASEVDNYPAPQQGRYREIEAYYSVQNTFPDVYRTGYNSPQSEQPDYQVALSRQLKGYLMVFDQLLANQLAQLAHVGDLFSFDGGRASDRTTPTYYCQPLYDVPAVQPLLLGTEAYQFQFDPALSDGEVRRAAWKQYKREPLNPYMQGLRALMESDTEAARRRDAMLTHLLARHGEEASQYDEMIKEGYAFGSDSATRVIIKTIWLQNYQQLSYRRNRAFNFRRATPLGLPGEAGRPSAPPASGRPQRLLVPASPQEIDFINFSTFELKAGLLLGLPAHLRMLAQDLFALMAAPEFHAWLQPAGSDSKTFRLRDSDLSVVARLASNQESAQLFYGTTCLMDITRQGGGPLSMDDYLAHAQQLQWLGQQRQGFLLIEHGLLAPDTDHAQYCLQASMLFPAYVTRVQQAAFRTFVDTLVELHWPAHVGLAYAAHSHHFLRVFIPAFVTWHNSLPHRGKAPVAQIARLLKLPVPVQKDDHAG